MTKYSMTTQVGTVPMQRISLKGKNLYLTATQRCFSKMLSVWSYQLTVVIRNE